MWLGHHADCLVQLAVFLGRRRAIDDGRIELHRLRPAHRSISRHTRFKKPKTPLTPCMFQGFEASSGPMNISYSRSESAPYSLTIASG